MRVLLGLLALITISLPARAMIPHETFYFDGVPSADLVSYWSTLPGAKSFAINAGDPGAAELKPLAELRGADRIQVEVQRYPNEDSLPTWKALASQGVEFVALNKPGLPTNDEVRRLNEAGFAQCLFVLDGFPGEEEARRLGQLHCRVSLTFAISAYPKTEDKPALAAIPAQIPLLFATDYWPGYVHMDLLNLLPHRKQLRVLGMLPPQETLPYLRNIQRLDQVQISTDFDPEAKDWKLFEGLPLVWTSQGHVPQPAALEAYAASGAGRRLVIDSDTSWSQDERARIEHSPLKVEWIHSAPWQP